MIVIIQMNKRQENRSPNLSPPKIYREITPQKAKTQVSKHKRARDEPSKNFGLYVLESNICLYDKQLEKNLYERWNKYFRETLDNPYPKIERIYKIGTVETGFKKRHQNPTLSFLPPDLAGWHCVAWFGVNNKEDYKTIKFIETALKQNGNAYLRGKGVGQTEMIFNMSVENDIVPLCKQMLELIEYEYIDEAFFSGRNQQKRQKEISDALDAAKTMLGLPKQLFKTLKF
jgi:hypothetical protein